jgi:hypothetical protein
VIGARASWVESVGFVWHLLVHVVLGGTLVVWSEDKRVLLEPYERAP